MSGRRFLASLLTRPGPRVSLAHKTPFPFLFKRLPRRLELGLPGWLSYPDEFRLGFISEILARFPRCEKPKDPGDEF